MSDDNKVIDIFELQTAKQVTNDVPKILVILNKLQDELYDYMSYQDVADVSSQINYAKVMLEHHLKHYNHMLKGK